LVASVGVAAVVVALTIVIGPSRADAATLTVSTTTDVAPTFGACGNPAQTSPTGGSLREAICVANNLGATSSTITVPAGTYTLINGELQMGKVSGSNITLTGAGAASTIISGNNASRVFDLDPSVVGGVTTSISGVTITGGAVTTFGGAGIIAGSGHAGTGDTLTVSNSTISNNHVNSATTNKYGGGLEFQGGSLTITNSTFSGNTSGSSSGSAVEYQHLDVASGEQLTVSGVTFSGNSTNASVSNINVGGALHMSGVSATVPMTVTNSRFVTNTVVGSGTGIPQGAGIFSEGGSLTVTESTFTSNSVAGGSNPQGGAISVLGGTAAVHYSRITGNTGATGSGVSLGAFSGATLNATDNWWGCNTGPGTAGCDAAAGSPTVSPRLVLTATASPATVVGPNATSSITAALTQNSLGSAIGAANLDAFAGLPVGFSDPLPSGATLSAASANLAAGSASTTYNSQNTVGPGHVLATLDNGTATATVTVNRPPAITSTNTASFAVGTASSFTVTTTGYPAPAISRTGTLPAGMTFTDNGNGTATLAGTPTAGGSYPLNLTASNGVSPNATQTLSITVGQAAAFTSAATAAFTVGTAGSFSVTTTPTAYPTPTITKTGTLPSGLTFTDNGNGTATLAGTPSAGAGGSYSLSLTASNGVNPNGTQTLAVNVNQAPAVTTNPSNQGVAPGASVSFTAAASGFPTPTVQWQRSVDGGSSFGNISGATSPTYTFTASAGDNGNQYRAVFTNSTGSATTTAATLTVSGAPTISSASSTSFVVGSAGTFTVTTSGFPSATLTTSGTLPAWLSFTDNADGTATIAGTPPAGSGGSYGFTIHADNGTAPSDSQAFTLNVDESPAITSADHAAFQAGTPGSFLVTTSGGFPVATTITKTGSLPSGVTFTDNGDGTATLAGTPAAGTAGSYPLTVTAANGASPAAQQSFTLTVLESPVITSADHATFVTGTAGSFSVTTSGGAGTTVSYTGTLPSGVTFSGSGTGATIAGTPGANTGGTYSLTIIASDGVTPDTTQIFTLTVDQPPVITSADHNTFTLGVAGAFTVTTAPGVPPTTTITKTGALPAGVSFTDNGDGTATLAGTPTAAGTFPITITATNGVAPDGSQSFTLTVNQAPAITSSDHTTFGVGSAGTFTVTTSPTADTVTETGALPSGVTFTDNGDGTATLGGTPAAGTGGVYALSINATNTVGFTTQSFTLSVHELASFTSADHATFVVGAAGNFTVTTNAGYPAATTITKTGALPAGVSFTDNGDGTATMAGTPADGTAGSYPLTLTAANAAGNRQQSFTFNVQPANASPVITSADHTTFAFGTAGSFTVTTTAGFPAATTITKTGALPAGVTFTDNGDGTATIAGTPAGFGVFTITITASNGATTNATQSFSLTVTRRPAISSGDAATFVVGTAGSFTVTTTPGYPTTTTMTVTGARPSGVSFTDNGDGTATLAGTPAAASAGTYPLTITATNAAGSTQQAFTLTVDPANRPPTADAGGPYTVGEGGTLTLHGSGTDADGDALTFSWDVNSDGTFGDATGATPTLTWSQLSALGINDGPASRTVKVRVDDAHGGTTDSSGAALSVTNTAPAVTITGPSDVAAGAAFSLSLAASDPSSVDQAAGFDDTVDWGDGTTSGPTHGSSPVTRSHTYASPGVYQVSVSAADKDGGAGHQTTAITVAGARLMAGVCGGTDLVVGGTSGNDTIRIAPGASTGSVSVTINGQARGSFTPTGRLVVLGQAGNDTVTVDTKLTLARLVYGGTGDDIITGGNGNGIQIGGDGADRLSAGNGRDILIGGTGADTLDASKGDDIVVAGASAYDDLATARGLCGVQAEWTRTDLGYTARIAHLDGTTPGGLNGTALLTSTGAGRTAFDDSSVDAASGGLGQDWYLVNTSGGTALDSSDAAKGEIRTDL
jgi:hypothetical protein